MRSTPVSLLGGFNRDDSPAWAVQDVVNWLPVVADHWVFKVRVSSPVNRDLLGAMIKPEPRG